MDKMLIGNRLREAREDKGLTQTELAALVGVSQRQIWSYENGKSDITGRVLTRLADVLDISIDYLFGRTDGSYSHFTGIQFSPEEIDIVVTYRSGNVLELISRLAKKNS